MKLAVILMWKRLGATGCEWLPLGHSEVLRQWNGLGYVFTPGSTLVIYMASEPGDSMYQLYTMPLSGLTPWPHECVSPRPPWGGNLA